MAANDIGEHFPHSTYKSNQEIVLKQLKGCIDRDDVDIVVLQAGTGFGKTSVAGAVGSWTGSAYYVADQKIHQEHAKRAFPDELAVVQGKNNYNCGEYRDPPCEDVLPKNKGSCKWKPTPDNTGEVAAVSEQRGELRWGDGVADKCPYMRAKVDGMNAPIACFNYAYALNELYYSDDFSKRAVAIFDEAHNIEQKVQDFLSFRIDETVENELGVALKDRGPEVRQWAIWLRRIIGEAIESRVETINAELYRKSDSNELASLKVAKERLTRFQWSIERFTKEWNDDIPWAVDRKYEDGEIAAAVFTPITIAPYTDSLLFEYADTVILMSATILDTDTFLRTHGLMGREDDVYFINVDNSFPVSNRPVYYYDGLTINHDNWSANFPKICQLTDNLCREYHPDEPGIIHAVSFKNEEMLVDVVSDETRERLYTHSGDGDDREDVLEAFKESENGILVTPSMYEGVDLKGDMSRFQIIPKVPFLDLSSQVVSKHKDVSEKWYAWRTAVRLIQSFGRSVRDENDHAETYVLDGSFDGFYTRNKYLFPGYVRNALEKRDLMELT